MNLTKRLLLAAALAATTLAPLSAANAWDRGDHGGYWGGGYHGGWDGHRDYRHDHHDGAAGAAIVGLALGTLFGAAIAQSAPPPPPAERCRSIVVQGVRYYNCDGYQDRYDDGGYGNNDGDGYYNGNYDDRYSGSAYYDPPDSPAGWAAAR